jgi:DNA repair photolyase
VDKNKLKGRGSQFNLPNRFEKTYTDFSSDEISEHVNLTDEGEYSGFFNNKIPTTFYNDHSKSILVKNDSPDLGAGYSINPYRGCEHGCIYCYARPTHEYLGFSPGLDFETKIMVKNNAPELLAKEFSRKNWIPQTVFFSGNTDCYQPVERKLELTRKCLGVFAKFRNPVAVITKNSLIKRDADILAELAKYNLTRVVLSVTTLKKELQQKMEPRTSSPYKRLETISFLSSLGIPVSVNIAPIIPGLNDEEIPEILKLASQNGAVSAGRVVLRLPHGVKELFTSWLEKEYPERSGKVINRIKELRRGKLYDSSFGTRLTGEGIWAETIKKIFDTNCAKYNLNTDKVKLSVNHFERDFSGQAGLFD